MSYSPFGWDYPAGAEHDPDAPWNQKDAEVCSDCDGTGKVTCDRCDGNECSFCEEGQLDCKNCDGEGTL